MIASFLLLIACCWVIVYLLRAVFIGLQGPMIEQDKEIPFSFAFGTVPYPAGDTFVLGLETSLWTVPDPARPPGGGAAPTTAPVTRVGYKLGREEWWLGPGRIERRIDGRAKAARGRLAITDRRVRFTGKTRTVDVPLADIASLSVRGPLLELERRSAPGEPVAFKVPQPVMVAKVIQALVVRGAARRGVATRR
jgi:hypothetical protein